MQGIRAKCKVASLIIISALVALAALYGLLRPVSSGCIMTYMYPTYIPISARENGPSSKYGLYLYHEGWKRIDFVEHLKQLNGVPVLFIPGNGGSFKQVRSLAAESDRAYQGGPFRQSFYQEASLTPEEGGDQVAFDSAGFQVPSKYTRMLDWFSVDLEGEHSAMDGRILEEHADYVVHAIHMILDKYFESYYARKKEGIRSSSSLPDNVILVGHSMGGFVARAAVVHPRLRKSVVQTVVTLSSPHQSPPIAFQPSLGSFFSEVNKKWRRGYHILSSGARQRESGLELSHVVTVSISGGYNDYQVRTKLESLEGIIPQTHGFMISSTGMKKVWLSMEHQTILWCNQLVVQMSHTLLSLVDAETGRPFASTEKRLLVFAKMLRSVLPLNFNSIDDIQSTRLLAHIDPKNNVSGSQEHTLFTCPSNIQWKYDGFERDLDIQSTTVSVLAMDGRRRWLDIQNLVANDKGHFIFVTNLAPCYGIKLHLCHKKRGMKSELPACRRAVEVTSRMVHIPSGPSPRQAEPGSQTEQAPPSSIFWLRPKEMVGFRYLTISVSPRSSLSGSSSPVTSMAVGQFFNPKEGQMAVSVWSLLFSAYSENVIFLKEGHPLAFNLSFRVSLGILPITLSLRTVGCGIKKSDFPVEEAGDVENTRLCKLRCFPPAGLVWDATSGFHVLPNLYSEIVTVDSSPGFWISTLAPEKTMVLLLVDPHCSYKVSIAVSVSAAASRFFLLYAPQIIGLCFAAVLFTLMQQARFMELELPLPSTLTSLEYNLRMPFPFLLLVLVPICSSLVLSSLMSRPIPSVGCFVPVIILCYVLANASVIILTVVSQLAFYVSAVSEAFIRTRWQMWERIIFLPFLKRFLDVIVLFPIKVMRTLKLNALLFTMLIAILLACAIHPALGLFVLILFLAFSCHSALCSSLMASFHSHARVTESLDSSSENCSSSPGSSNDTEIEIFHHLHSVLVLHLLAALMFVPSLVAWVQRVKIGHSFPMFLDSTTCIGIILHAACTLKHYSGDSLLTFPGIPKWASRMSYVYGLAGFYSFLCGLSMAPYMALYAVAVIGVISVISQIVERMKMGRDNHFSIQKHFHRH